MTLIIGVFMADLATTLKLCNAFAVFEIAVPVGDSGLADAFCRATGLSPPPPSKATEGDGLVLLWAGAGRFHLVGEEKSSRIAIDTLRASLGARGAMVDLSAARKRFRLTGPGAREILAAGTTMDVRPSRFKQDDCALTALAKFNVMIHVRRWEETYDIYVDRSFSASFAGWFERTAGLTEGGVGGGEPTSSKPERVSHAERAAAVVPHSVAESVDRERVIQRRRESRAT